MARVARDARGKGAFVPFVFFVFFVVSVFFVFSAAAQDIPELTKPVNDFANVIDPASEQAMETLIRSLQQATGDAVVVASIDTFAPYADIREYAVKMFENGGRGIGQKGKDNGALILLAVKDRQVRVEVGYDLEEFITDGFAGEVSRQLMTPEFRRGNYGAGLRAGLDAVVSRIAQRRNVTLQGVPRATPTRAPETGSGGTLLLAMFVIFMVINAMAGQLRGGRRNARHWGGGGWSGWSSGVGPFGGGFGGGGGGGFGCGFGGFGGGGSGGGGGGSSW